MTRNVGDLPVCPIMQECDHPTGWHIEEVHWEETVTLRHLMPCNDLRPHQLDVDHKDGDRANNDPSNWQTLCANCHRLKTVENEDWRK